MEENMYEIFRIGNLNYYYEGIDELDMSPRASVAYAFDSSYMHMSTIPEMCAAAVITLSIISVRSGFLPDYLEAMLSKMRDISDLLHDDDKVCYRNDVATLTALLAHVPHCVIETGTSFMKNVDSLLPPSILK